MFFGSNLPYLFVRCHFFQSFFFELFPKAKSKLENLRHKEIAKENARGRTTINNGRINTNNINMQNVQINVKNQTRGRSKSKTRARSKSRSKSRTRWTTAQGNVNKKQVKFQDESESETSDTEADERLAAFLQRLNMSQYANRFAMNEMGYDDLNDMTNDRLKDIGVTKLKHRDVILNGIKERIHNLSSDDDKDFRPASKQ